MSMEVILTEVDDDDAEDDDVHTAWTRGVTGASLSFDLGSAEPRLASYLFLYVFSVL